MRVCKLISASLLRLYAWMQARHPELLWRGDPSRREIALTFDDGPHPRDTPRVLQTLADHHIHGTFFLVGRFAKRYPSLVKQIHDHGHQVALHGYYHRPFVIETSKRLVDQMYRAKNIIAEACGISPDSVRDVRPPYGVFSRRITSLFQILGYRIVMWTSVPLHWWQPLSWTIKQTLGQTIPGGVILFHDGKGHGKNLVNILNIIIPELKAQGFKFVAIEEMQTRKNQIS